VERVRRRTGTALAYEPSQGVGERFAGVPRELFGAGVVRVETDGTWTFAGEAVLQTLADGGRRWPLVLYRRVPLVAPLVELGYALVARLRGHLPHPR
jgi:hypothetical protein